VGAALAAVIAAVTSVVVTGLSLVLGERQRRRREEQAQRQDLNAAYLNPLRLHLVENYYRLADTVRHADAAGGRYEAMLTVTDPAESPARMLPGSTAPAARWHRRRT
jgi:Na+-transporting NADH:ubiquinone oxidoreductase subunit NqrC